MIANTDAKRGKLSVTLTPEEERKAKIVEAALVKAEHTYDPAKYPRTRYGAAPWPRGRWDEEPDVVEWRESGVSCLVVRMSDIGHLNGYVGVPEGHPWWGVGYDDIKCGVHGGLTYSAHATWEHLPDMGAPITVNDEGLWWVGFDCNHSGDFAPGMGVDSYTNSYTNSYTGSYKTIGYVVAEIECIVQQALEAKRDHLRR